jgi:Galactose oxidase, central domain
MDGGTTSWELVTNMTGKIPKPISHHSGFIIDDTLYVYGGLIEADSNPNFYALNLNTMNWTIVD